MSKLRMIAFFAHPDDEVFSCGGVMALNQKRDIHTTLVCATKGEAGEISSPELADIATIGAVREQELIEAAKYVGIDDLQFLGYRDSGMAGTPANEEPAAYTNALASEVVPRLVRFIRDLQPQVIITFDPTGGYGHPDHIAIHKHTVEAFHAAADPAYYPEFGEPWQTQRLFYPVFQRTIFTDLHDQLLAQGIEPPKWFDGDDAGPEFPDQPVHARVQVSSVVVAKWAAFKCHRTQFGKEHPFMLVPEDFIMKLIEEEWFELAWPEEKPETPLTDLFADLPQ
jgi:LmbE family N-acetylglucosaminyl deacetylase